MRQALRCSNWSESKNKKSTKYARSICCPPHRAFISYLGTIRQLSEKPHVQTNNENGRSSSKGAEFDNEHAHIAISDLKKVATLGAGAFGRVDLVTHNSKAFALKIIKKIEVIKQDQIEHVYNEKNVMIKCRDSPFIVQ